MHTDQRNAVVNMGASCFSCNLKFHCLAVRIERINEACDARPSYSLVEIWPTEMQQKANKVSHADEQIKVTIEMILTIKALVGTK